MKHLLSRPLSDTEAALVVRIALLAVLSVAALLTLVPLVERVTDFVVVVTNNAADPLGGVR